MTQQDSFNLLGVSTDETVGHLPISQDEQAAIIRDLDRGYRRFCRRRGLDPASFRGEMDANVRSAVAEQQAKAKGNDQ
jgi:hypothetical protein